MHNLTGTQAEGLTSLLGKAIQPLPEMTDMAEARAITFVEGASLSQIIRLLDAQIERVSTELGCATWLEDARCAILREIDERGKGGKHERI